jgi:hypothetical protein
MPLGWSRHVLLDREPEQEASWGLCARWHGVAGRLRNGPRSSTERAVMATKAAEYMRRRRAEGKAWDQRPENRERVAKRKREWFQRMWWGVDTPETNHKHFRFRATRGLRGRRSKALGRMDARNAERDFNPEREAKRV